MTAKSTHSTSSSSATLPPLHDIGRLLHHVEQQHRITFQRQRAAIRTNLPSVEFAVRAWVLAL